MALENIDIQNKLVETFGESVFNFQEEKDLFSFENPNPDKNTAVILFLKNSEDLRFHFLNDFVWNSLS